MSYERPIVLSIAGFDPSGGAGALADIKTMEQHKCLGMSVLTSNTIQTEDIFYSIKWISLEEIIDQLKVLFIKYPISYVKIGIVENLQTLLEIVRWLKIENENVHIIWDPVITSSTGFTFLKNMNDETLNEILLSLFLITPNIQEVQLLTKMKDFSSAANHLSQYCSVFLKGGHNTEELGVDYLIENDTKYKLSPSSTDFSPKHGTGCIISTAITCNLAHGNVLIDACENAKKYIERILGSNNELLAYHNV